MGTSNMADQKPSNKRVYALRPRNDPHQNIAYEAQQEEAKRVRTPGFFELPRELRDEIYDIALRGLLCCPTYRGLKLHLAYHRHGAPALSDKEYWGWDYGEVGMPGWLFTSKQMLEEGLEQFYRFAQCAESLTRTIVKDVRRPKANVCSLHRVRRLCMDETNDIGWHSREPCDDDRECSCESSDPCVLRNLWLRTVRETTGGDTERVLSCVLDDDSVTWTMLRYLKERPGDLRELQLRFHFPRWAFDGGVNITRVDLSQLEEIPKGLQRVEFIVEVYGYERYVEDHRTSSIWSLFKEEVVRVAKLLACDGKDQDEQRCAILMWEEEPLRDYWHCEARRVR